ncbi:von Willebrand factor type A domain-containing protein [Nocardia nova SH22a]|uniref:von Willebrand factor type A domain-containing protein n=1 Tax=Nocardia nova SH22a TaxID=1415166 RepID=W5TKL2_9NOCA|nr:VWA domain-containing protein [Nocardia nova]AHH17776.1 von Willebrand factor type A domain-containing protein [Nocardia nova SH22a]
MDTPAGSGDVTRFGLLASAVAGRALRVAAAPDTPPDAAPGASTWTDGRAVFVDPAMAAPDQVVAIAVQSSLIAAGSLDPAVIRRLPRRSPSTVRRYLTVEAHRALAAGSDLLPRRVRALIDVETAERSDCAATSLAIAAGREPVAEPLPQFGRIRPKSLLAMAEKTSVDSAAEPPRSESPTTEADSLDGGDEESYGRLPALFTNVVGGRGPLARLLRRMLTPGRESEGGFTGGGVPKSARAVAKPDAVSAPATGNASAVEAIAGVGGEGVRYPEWDVHRNRYRRDWCTVVESDPRPGSGRIPPAVVSSALNRSLAKLRLSLDQRRHRPQGDDLDVDAVVDHRVQLLAGFSPDDAVYIESSRCKPDLAIMILLDISGSAGLPSISGGSVHEQQRAAAAQLTAALHGLGNRVALYGFYSQGRSAVRMLRVKRFSDRLDAAATARLTALEPMAYTRLGAAVRHGTAMLARPGAAARTLLVVLSDGLAYDYGYEGAYAEADARRALAEARRDGTGCVCLSVGAGADIDSLRRVFGTAAHASVGRPGDVATVAGPLFRDALRSADLRRRMDRRRTARVRRRTDTSRRTA